MTPTVKWTLPDGFTVSEFQHPVPDVHVAPGDIVSYIHEGEPMLIAKVLAPADLNAADEIKIGAKVQYLVCKELCVLMDASVDLAIPVVTAHDQVKPVNEDHFEDARYSWPKPISESNRAIIKVSSREKTIGPGQSFEVIITLDITKGYHIQSDNPGNEFLVPTRIFLEPADGIEFTEPIYPKSHEREVPGLGKVREFSGSVPIRIPAKAENDIDTTMARIAGLIQYQSCSDKTGQCDRHFTAEWSIEIPVDKTKSAIADSTAETSTASTATDQSEDEPFAATSDSPGSEFQVVGGGSDRSLIVWLLFGFLGGLILNVMPCVLPVISIKILSFVQQSGEDRRRILMLGLSFCAGILAWFLGLAFLIAFTTGGKDFKPLQSPDLVIALTAVMFAFALSLFGVFEINLPWKVTQSISDTAEKEGYLGAFLKGLLATLLGTACTAPLLAPAVGWAVTQQPLVTILVFLSAGIGMAYPYLLLSANPAWMKFLPKPGNWMVTFKQAMGFLLIATAIWLLWVLNAQIGGEGVVWTACFLSFLGFACWLLGKTKLSWSTAGRSAMWLIALGVTAAGWHFSYGIMYDDGRTDYAKVDWVDFRKGLPQELANEGRTVYVDYTARWCASCLSNKKVAIETKAVKDLMDKNNVVAVKADYTSPNKDITADLHYYGRNDVPLNIILPANHPEKAIILPTILTQDIVLTHLKKAGPSTAAVAELPATDSSLEQIANRNTTP
jgi:thiol:disulfide interchange protein DsbD